MPTDRKLLPPLDSISRSLASMPLPAPLLFLPPLLPKRVEIFQPKGLIENGERYDDTTALIPVGTLLPVTPTLASMGLFWMDENGLEMR